ncbi:gluconate:H+ symporter [Pectinatus cerevisiiphilus]|uniref:Gluconate permease GntP n=1 Tax=Pectinatus cerevisiiphilus TaxID=86956 RepID=A0A4R3K2W7_9FIRM|nr:gluconate:H+ symporter [Pectinatus cerevisiiphilus]TCS76768.1 gluconate permease GntP [Pectinatus cerevisiiphilus]
MPLIITACAVVLLIILISKFRMNTFISLLIISIFAAICFGIPLNNIAQLLEAGIGGTLGHIALIFGLGAMLGRLVADAGGAQQISMVLIDKFGTTKIQLAVLIASFIIGIAMFFEVGLVLLLPIIFSIAKEMKIAPLYLGIPMTASLLSAHCFLPPHPGPTVIAGEYGANIGTVLLYGIIVAIPTVIIAGLLFPKIVKRIIPNAFERNGNISTLGTTTVFKNEELPSFSISLFTAMLPVILMMGGTISTIVADFINFKGIYILNLIEFIGKPSIAMIISILVAMYTMGIKRNISVKHIMTSCSTAVAAIAMMLLIIGGGGAFKQVLIDGGVGQYISVLFEGSSVSPIILAWCVAAILRISLGSATVAAISTSGLIIPLLSTYDANLALVTLATGAGSTIASHVNDAAFWMVKEYFGLTMKETFFTWTLMSTIQAICGLLFILLLEIFV